MKRLELERTYPGPDVYMYATERGVSRHTVSVHFDAPGMQFVAFFSQDEALKMAALLTEAAETKREAA